MLETLYYLAAEDVYSPGRWFENEASSLEVRVVIFLGIILLGIIIYNVIDQVRLYLSRRRKAWKSFFRLAREKRLSAREQNLLLKMVRENGIHPPTRLFMDSRVFESCAAREIERIQRSILQYVEKKMLAFQITALRKKLGYSLAGYGRYVEHSREIEPGQEITITYDHDGRKDFVRAEVNSVDDLEFAVPLPPSLRGAGALKPGMDVNIQFLQPGNARYEFDTRVLEVSPHSIHLEHRENISRIQERRFVRAEIDGVVSFSVARLPDGRSSKTRYTGRITDVSAGGLGFSFDRPIPEGTELLMDLDFSADQTYKGVKGKVLRSYPVGEGELSNFRVHLQFESFSEKQQDELVKFIFKTYYRKD